MVAVDYFSTSVTDPKTDQLRTDLFGAKMTVVYHGTNTPVPNLLEGVSRAPLANPITVTSIGRTPWMVIEDGPDLVDIISGDYRTTIWSPSGTRAYAATAATAAAEAVAGVDEILQLADVVDLVAGANITLTPTDAGVVIASTGGGGGGGFTGTVTVSQISDRSATGETVLKGTPAQGRGALEAGQSNVKVSGAFTGDAAPLATTVTLGTAQTITGAKTFTAAPVVPDGSFTVAKVVGLEAALNNVSSSGPVTYATAASDSAYTIVKTGGVWPGGSATAWPRGATYTNPTARTTRTDLHFTLMAGDATPPTGLLGGSDFYERTA